MKTDLRRFAPIGLGLAAIGLIVALLTGLLKLFTYLGLPALPIGTETINMAGYAGLALLVIGLGIFALLDPQKTRALFTGRSAQNGSNALIILIAFLGILFIANSMAYQFPTQWDLTEDKQNSLAPETLDTLAALPEPVTAYAFYTGSLPETDRLLLDNYKRNSNGSFDYTQIDPEANPLLAKELGVTRDATIVFVMGKNHEQVSYNQENEFTGALIRLINPESRVIYFLTGHGERSIDGQEDTSYSIARQVLEGKNYTVRTLNLLAENKIPEDASLIVIAGPTNPLDQREVTLLDEYLKAGGAMMAMAEPTPLTDFGASNDPLAAYLTNEWGITLENDLVLDPSVDPNLATYAYEYGNSPITVKLDNQSSLYFTARSLSIADSPTGLVFTTENAWGETDFNSLASNTAAFDANTDHPGQLTLAATAQDNNTNSRMVVFGDADFGTNALFSQYANGDVFVNSVDWATGLEDVINLTPKPSTMRLFTPPSVFGLIGIVGGSLCLIPLLILIAGISAAISRRRRG